MNRYEMLFEFIIYALSVYRFTILIYEENGPFNIIKRFRCFIGITETETLTVNELDISHGIVIKEVNGQLAELVNCPFCLSGWIGLVMAAGLVLDIKILDFIALWGALWGVVYILLNRFDHEF